MSRRRTQRRAKRDATERSEAGSVKYFLILLLIMSQMRSYDNVIIALSTLAAGAVLTSPLKIDGARENGIRLQKMKAQMSFRGLTDGEGPVVIGLATTDPSVTEIAEVFTADPQKPEDIPASEQVMRKIFPIWMIGKAELNSVTRGVKNEYTEIQFPWKNIEEGTGLKWFAVNLDASATLTTGGVIEIVSVTIGTWLDD